MSQVKSINESSEVYEVVISRVWNSLVRCKHVRVRRGMHALCMSSVTCMNESCHTYESVTSHVWMSPVTRKNESCHTYKWVMSHLWMSHVTRANESCHPYEWVMSPKNTNESDKARMNFMCCSVLQYVAVCCSVMQCFAVYCSVLQCVAVWRGTNILPNSRRMSHVTPMNKSCHKCEWVMSHV